MSLLIIATHNKGKLHEFELMFKQIELNLPLETMANYPELDEVKETGKTFEENARLKAETIAQLTNQIVLADDSGLVIPGLNGEPGVYSARYSGDDHNDYQNNLKVLEQLAERSPENREAYFVSCIVVSYLGKESLVVEGRAYGEILDELSGDQGFGYDPLFYVADQDLTFAQMTTEQKNALSHRGAAIKKLRELLPKWLEANDLI
ncbi:XTP/dITP diphosphatase [Aerococcaceae bacterium DSM 111176]|nr:XTP/dITP diphosphatase [Aerococcaceae bacterium DSM 111176]